MIKRQQSLYFRQLESLTSSRWIALKNVLLVYLHIVKELADVHQFDGVLGHLDFGNFRFYLLFNSSLLVFDPEAGKVSYNKAAKLFVLRHGQI